MHCPGAVVEEAGNQSVVDVTNQARDLHADDCDGRYINTNINPEHSRSGSGHREVSTAGEGVQREQVGLFSRLRIVR